MKIPARILALILTILLLAALLTGCGQKPTAPAVSSGGTSAAASTGAASGESDGTPSVPDPDPAPIHRYRGAGGPTLAENGPVRYFVLGGYLGYYDGLSGESGPLCGRPECTHQDWTCDAYMNWTKLFACEGDKLYWLGANSQYGHVKGAPMEYGIWRANLDGTGRELVKEFPEELLSGAIYDIVLRGKKVFVNVRELLVQDGVPENRYCWYETGLNDDQELKELLEYDGDGACQVIRDYLYYMTFADPGSETTPPRDPEITRYHLDTGETEVLLAAGSEPEMTGVFYVCDNLTVYFSDTRQDLDTTRLYRLTEGRLEPIPGTEDETHTFGTLYLTEGLAYCNHWTPQGEEIWLSDFEGNTLYKGPWEMQFREKKENEVLPVSRALLGGGTDHCLFCFADYLAGHTWIVQYDITPEGLSETILWDWTGAKLTGDLPQS